MFDDLDRRDWSLLLLLALLLLILFPGSCFGTTLTGHLAYGGQPLTGYVSIGLVYPGTNGSVLDLPGSPGPMRVDNGNFPAITLDGNDTLLPRGTFYQVTYYDAYQAPLARMNYVITGASFDLGAAVPTPVTTSNINFLDLLGIRNLSAQNLQLTNGITLGPVVYSSTGVTGAKQFDDLRFASAYASTGTTCGIAEAIAALPSAGGTIILQAGSCTLTSGVVISKPVTLLGVGQGGSTASATYVSPTLLVNGTQGSDLITVTTGPNRLSGVTLSNFAIKGNATVSGATLGTGVTLAGGTGGLANITLDRLLVYEAFGAGVLVADNTGAVHINQVVAVHNGGPGLAVTANTAAAQGISITQSGFDSNTGDGVTISGAMAGQVGIADSYLTNNTGNGIQVAAGATGASVSIIRSQLTGNGNAGADFEDGFGHVVESSALLPGTHQLYGVVTNQPTITSSTVELTLRDNNIAGNLTTDVVQGATVSNLLLYPQSTAFTSAYGAPGTVHVIAPATPWTCSGTSCYTVAADGTITARGVTTASTSGGTVVNVAITFPTTFTAAPVLVTSGNSQPDGADDAYVIYTKGVGTTGATAVIRCSTNIGGSGCPSLSTAVPVSWIAIGR